VVSYGPRSSKAPKPGNAANIVRHAKKLGRECLQYICDRISGTRQMPALADLIQQREKTPTTGGP